MARKVRAHLDVEDRVSLVRRYLCANDFEGEVICQPIVPWQLISILFPSYVLHQSHFLITAHTYCWLALRSDMTEEFQFFWIIIVDAIETKVILIFG